MKLARFKIWTCTVDLGRYTSNDRVSITLRDIRDNAVVAVASLNIPDIELGKDLVVIKNYSENEGVLNALIEAGVVSQPIAYIQTGYVSAPICKLL